MRAFVRHGALPSTLALALALTETAHADPYRLRIDTVAYTQSPQSPVGLVVLQGEDKANPWVDAEALAWAGSTNGNYDVLSALVRLHDPKNFAELRLGRQILTVGALRPVHVDGADARLRSPMGSSVEAFGGVPVEPQFAYRAYDWLAGGRLAQRVGKSTSLGVSYLQQREYGRLSYEETGLDFASAPARWFDLSAHGAYDLIDPGLAEAGASLAGRFGDVRPEIYATHRSPSRLIPATSLFSALGDTPSDVVGASLKWRMFPRLDALPLIAARDSGGDVGLDGTLRVTLRLDDRGDGALSVEARRQGAGMDRWTGGRLTARVPLTARVRCSTELELVAPDDSRGRGAVWPWGLVAVRWIPVAGWEIAGAVEAALTATATREVNALARLSWMWGGAMKRLTVLLMLSLLLAACAQILGIRPPERKPFPHHEHTAKGGIGCLQCHAGILDATDTGPLHLPTTAVCIGCHTKPHDTRECKGCHGLDYVRDEAQMDLDHLKFKHSTHSQRLKDNCAYCHRGVETNSDHVRPTMGLCLSCHEHQDDFAPARACDRCHKDLRAEDVRPASHVAHDGDWLREHGNRAYAARDLCSTCHAEKFCAGCHGLTVPALPEKLAFDDTMRAGVHRAGFVSRHSLEARTQPGLCSTCHATGQFCESCHAKNGIDVASGGRSPHPSGWVGLRGESNDHGRAAWSDPSVCAACHSGAGEQLCIGCHKVGAMGGSPHRPGWTSKMRPTIDQPCRSCHEGTP